MRQVKYSLRAKLKCLNVRGWKNLSGAVLLFKITENLLESKPFKTLSGTSIFLAKSALCMLSFCIYLI